MKNTHFEHIIAILSTTFSLYSKNMANYEATSRQSYQVQEVLFLKNDVAGISYSGNNVKI